MKTWEAVVKVIEVVVVVGGVILSSDKAIRKLGGE